MEKNLIIALVIFLIVTFLFWKFTNGYYRKGYGEKLWNHWSSRLFYWQGVIYTCTGITFVILYLLKWANVLTL